MSRLRWSKHEHVPVDPIFHVPACLYPNTRVRQQKGKLGKKRL